MVASKSDFYLSWGLGVNTDIGGSGRELFFFCFEAAVFIQFQGFAFTGNNVAPYGFVQLRTPCMSNEKAPSI